MKHAGCWTILFAVYFLTAVPVPGVHCADSDLTTINNRLNYRYGKYVTNNIDRYNIGAGRRKLLRRAEENVDISNATNCTPSSSAGTLALVVNPLAN